MPYFKARRYALVTRRVATGTNLSFVPHGGTPRPSLHQQRPRKSRQYRDLLRLEPESGTPHPSRTRVLTHRFGAVRRRSAGAPGADRRAGPVGDAKRPPAGGAVAVGGRRVRPGLVEAEVSRRHTGDEVLPLLLGERQRPDLRIVRVPNQVATRHLGDLDATGASAASALSPPRCITVRHVEPSDKEFCARYSARRPGLMHSSSPVSRLWRHLARATASG